MIEMVKKSAISFQIRIDIQGIEDLINYIKKIKRDNNIQLQIVYLDKNKNFEIELNEDVWNISINDEFIKLYMDEEELDYLEQRLKDAFTSGYFYPAEICERNYKGKNVTLYCEVI